MLSKPVGEHYNKDKREPKKKKNNVLDPSMNVITYVDYFSKKLSLKSFKIPYLKLIAKTNKLHITGNKTVLINRIEDCFQKMQVVTKIQRIFRGWLVKHSFRLRGPALKTRSICINDKDFATLEPLDEIPFNDFFSYKDSKEFVYGFNIQSLIQSLKTKGGFYNPYTRESFDYDTLVAISTLNNINNILFPNDDIKPIKTMIGPISNSPSSLTNRFINLPQSMQNVLATSYFRPRCTFPTSNRVLKENYDKIMAIRCKPVSIRMQELFMEIDQLGNYTQSNWFSNLDRSQYIRFYRYLLDIWLYRGHLSPLVKNNICPLFDPFINIFVTPIHHTDITHEQIQILCLTIFENLVYTGIDVEHRQIGALHGLTALTIVSPSARQSLNWLYESVAY
uniref:SAP domain-containing protein n=1 Tax=viral metagenome TaxID=1070528 RepID=A0A6C0DRF3_9ZZZZ